MTRQAFTPREYQQPVIDHILDVSRDAVWAGMGMGKTVSALTALDILEITEPGPALVLAPLRVAASTWPDEAMKSGERSNCPVILPSCSKAWRSSSSVSPSNPASRPVPSCKTSTALSWGR